MGSRGLALAWGAGFGKVPMSDEQCGGQKVRNPGCKECLIGRREQYFGVLQRFTPSVG